MQRLIEIFRRICQCVTKLIDLHPVRIEQRQGVGPPVIAADLADAFTAPHGVQRDEARYAPPQGMHSDISKAFHARDQIKLHRGKLRAEIRIADPDLLLLIARNPDSKKKILPPGIQQHPIALFLQDWAQGCAIPEKISA